MKISSVKIHGIKSYEDVFLSFEDYIVLVGENNSGKSNILFALLWFFGSEKLAKKDINDFVIDDPYVEVAFKMTQDEEFTHPAEYLVDGSMKVRATVKRTDVTEKAVACDYYGYTGNNVDSIKDTQLLGYKNFAKSSLGDIIYIPSLRPLSEEMKFTANSSLNQLVSKYVIARIKNEDEKNNHYAKVVESIKKLSDFISEGKDSALQRLKSDIAKQMLNYDGVGLDFGLRPPNADELIKSCFTPNTKVDGISDSLPVASQGDGFQRSMTFSLIANLAELNKKDSANPKSKKVAKNQCTFYIIEEPELFLHPNHQTYFRDKLEELSEDPASQVIICSHSPYFVNNIKNFSQLKRVYRNGSKSIVAQVANADIETICNDNGAFMADAKNECLKTKMCQTELQKEARKISAADEIRYLLWIDPIRANAFLARKVILVEGPTEKALFSYLFNNSAGGFYDNRETANITIVDTVGKYHFYKFACLLKQFGILAWAMYDGDDDKVKEGKISHKALNKIIEDLKSKDYLKGTLKFTSDLEKSLGLEKNNHSPDVSLYSSLVNDENRCKSSQGYKDIISFVQGVLDF